MSHDYRALTAKQNCLEKVSGPCGPREIRARTKAREWRARACGGVPSRACVGRIPRHVARVPAYEKQSFSEDGVHEQSRPLGIGS